MIYIFPNGSFADLSTIDLEFVIQSDGMSGYTLYVKATTLAGKEFFGIGISSNSYAFPFSRIFETDVETGLPTEVGTNLMKLELPDQNIVLTNKENPGEYLQVQIVGEDPNKLTFVVPYNSDTAQYEDMSWPTVLSAPKYTFVFQSFTTGNQPKSPLVGIARDCYIKGTLYAEINSSASSLLVYSINTRVDGGVDNVIWSRYSAGLNINVNTQHMFRAKAGDVVGFFVDVGLGDTPVGINDAIIIWEILYE